MEHAVRTRTLLIHPAWTVSKIDWIKLDPQGWVSSWTSPLNPIGLLRSWLLRLLELRLTNFPTYLWVEPQDTAAPGNHNVSTFLMKYGTQQQIRNSMTVMWPNIFFKFRMADGRHNGKCWKCLPMDQFGRNLGGRIPSRPRHARE